MVINTEKMNPVILAEEYIDRTEKLPAPKLEGYDSLHFHHLTSGESTEQYKIWGTEITAICKEQDIQYYYFLNKEKKPINVYPNEIIENWWYSKNIK